MRVTPILTTPSLINKFREVIIHKRELRKCKKCNEPKSHINHDGLCEDCTSDAWDRLLSDLKAEHEYRHSWEA